jgi:hypothetical protein
MGAVVDYPIEDATIDGYSISWVCRRRSSFRTGQAIGASNVIRRPGIGVIFFVPGFDETWRVNGTGQSGHGRSLSKLQGKVPVTGLLVSITEVFFRCGKARPLEAFGTPSRPVARDSFPSLGRIVADQTAVISVESAEQFVATSYREKAMPLQGDLHIDAAPAPRWVHFTYKR